MIRNVTNNEEIISLWSEAFCDSQEDILYFLDNCQHYICVGYYNDDRLCSMLFLVDCSLNGKSFKYVYAASTFIAEKCKGYMSRLLEYCFDKYSSICLIPANEPLISYYKNRKLVNENDISQLVFNEIDGINEYLFEGCELESPIVLSN